MDVKTKNNINSIIKESFPKKGWGLCIGAGTSLPIFPSWNVLVEKLIARDTSLTNPKSISDLLLSKFSADTAIQAVQNKLNLSDNDFANLLKEELYDNLSNLSGNKWESIKSILESDNPHKQKDPIWEDYIEIREKHFINTSAYSIGKFVHETIQKKIPPKVLLSFNAESLLFSLINSFEREKYLGKVKKKGQMISHLDRITHCISDSRENLIKYVFCHGLLLAPLSKKKNSLLTANDKLVFSENAYLSLASTNFSWQSTEFVSYCLNHTIIFIGVSLSDPNMRRWLSWIQKLKEHEIQDSEIRDKTKLLKSFYSHLWINVKPSSKDEEDWIEACVKHLGIKVIWIDKWEELETILSIMIK